MKTTKTMTALATTLPLLLAGCGALDRDDDKGRKVDEIDNDLVGTWLSACEPQGPFGIIELVGEKHELVFGVVPGDVVKTVHRYQKPDCTEPLYRLDIGATYSAVGDSPDVDGADNINYTVHDAKLTPSSEAAAGVLNDAKMCGATDWQSGVAKEITGVDCLGKKFSEGQVIFDIYDEEDGNLYVGKSSFFRDGDTSDSRPGALDREHPLVKQ